MRTKRSRKVGIKRTKRRRAQRAGFMRTARRMVGLQNVFTRANALPIRDATSFTIPYGITTIDDNCFAGFSRLENIIIPSSVTKIEYQGFVGCSSLRTVTFARGSKLEIIGKNAFAFCNNLTTIDLTQTPRLREIGDTAFLACSALDLIIPPFVTRVGDNAILGTINYHRTHPPPPPPQTIRSPPPQTIRSPPSSIQSMSIISDYLRKLNSEDLYTDETKTIINHDDVDDGSIVYAFQDQPNLFFSETELYNYLNQNTINQNRQHGDITIKSILSPNLWIPLSDLKKYKIKKTS